MRWIGWTMKHSCYSKYIYILIFLASSLLASLQDKSAMIYYGEKISYPVVGIHDYIIVDPVKTNTNTHGFKTYKSKMYAKVVFDKKVVNLQEELKKDIYNNFENFFFDVVDSVDSANAIKQITKFSSLNSQYKVIAKADIATLSKIHTFLTAIVVEEKRDLGIEKILPYGLDIIYVRYQNMFNNEEVKESIQAIKLEGLIPYITNDLAIYGQTSKNALKREILTLIDESIADRTLLSAHKHGAMVFEYMGYIQKLYDVSQGLPSIENVQHYAGVVVWLNSSYKYPDKLISWILALHKSGIKVAFVNNFGTSVDKLLLKELDIDLAYRDVDVNFKKIITQRDEIIGFETEPALKEKSIYLQPSCDAKPLLTYKNSDNLLSVPAAVTKWGGYALAESFMLELKDEYLWIINPFEFFQRALRLPKLLIPDTTTHNGNRLMFSHIDGHGMSYFVESDPNSYSAEVIYEKILKKYTVPHSVSMIGSEVSATGLYPELSTRLNRILRKVYSLENVEGATHTYSHPNIWSKIDKGDLAEEYRNSVKNYQFSVDSEIRDELSYINNNLLTKDKRKANMIFWSGDCAPEEDILEYVYKKDILNINGGNTRISATEPWLSYVSPLGIERGEYYQIYAGIQNENAYTNYWIGPYWGFKKVVQTLKMTNTPRRLKPIDIYYHFYSGSHISSLNAVKHVFEWSLKQEVMPIFTSEYIPKVMHYYVVSMANKNSSWLVEGMNNLKTLRIEKKDAGVSLKESKSVIGIKHFENHTYLGLNELEKHSLELSNNEDYKGEVYLISANGEVENFKNGINNKQYTFNSHVDLKISFNLPKNCTLKSSKKVDNRIREKEIVYLNYSNTKKVVIDVSCR